MGFKSWSDYQKFSQKIRSKNRFASDEDSKRFIEAVLSSVSKRNKIISAGRVLYRAQFEIVEEIIEGDDGSSTIHFYGHGRDRMIPLSEKVGDGRANPAKIAYLYLASSIKTAVSEIRPWIDSDVSVAEFKINRDLNVVDLTRGHKKIGFFELTIDQMSGKEQIDDMKLNEVVWIDIDSAFSKPVFRSENALEYVPTQILAEIFRENGYDGILYRSNFSDPSYNVCLFNLTTADFVRSKPYKVKNIEIEIEPY